MDASGERVPGTTDRVFLADFGLAKSVSTGSRFTRTGQALGTPAYMSPEQARGDSATLGPDSDVWALGAVLYEALAGRAPFEGVTEAEIVGKVILSEPAPIGRLRPDVPRALEPVIRACLAKDPRRRPGSGSALATDLDRLL
ncbi:MAG: serine/threonine protein kinase [Planctomycetales bacterium]|nr:serine/threonine protein kinase [Planctomycetales bacterium]